MKIISKAILFFILILIVIPVFSVFYYSFYNIDLNVFHWYKEVLHKDEFLTAFWLSARIAIVVALATSILGFIISLAWFNKRQRYAVILLIIILGLIPPDIIALGISQFSQFLGLSNTNLFFTVIGLMLYCLPFTILILWSRYYFIDNVIIKSSRDIGMKSIHINLKIVLGLSVTALFSSFLVNFILSINEYPRTYYLSGYHNFLSEYLYSKLNSGTDESIYAGSGLTILITCSLLLIGVLVTRLKAKKVS